MASTSVVFDILARDRASDKFDHLGKAVDGSTSKLGKFGSVAAKAGKAAGVGLALAGVAAVKFGADSVSAASDAQQSIGATETVFGEFADKVIRDSDRAAQTFGLSANSYRESANLIGSLFKNQGVALEELGGKTKTMIGTASDLAATFGGTTRDAVEALGSAFKGEFDPLEQYGISLKQSTVNAEAFKVAGVKTQAAFDKLSTATQTAAKQQASSNLIMRQSKDVQGAFARETDTLAHQQQVLAAKFENVKAKIGSVLLPAMTAVVKYVSNKVIPAFKEWWGWARDVVGKVDWGKLAGKMQPVVDLLRDIKRFAGNIDFSNLDAKQLGQSLGEALRIALTNLVGLAKDAAKSLGAMFAKVDWVGLGISIGKNVPALLAGLAVGLLNFDLGSLLGGLADHWQEVLLAVLAIAFAPTKLAAGLGRILAKVPFVGKFLERAVVWLNELGGKFTAMLGRFMSRAWAGFVSQVRFPGAGIITKVLSALRALPGRIRGFFDDLGARLFVWADDAALKIGTGIGKGLVTVLKFVASIPGRILSGIGNLARLLFPKGTAVIEGMWEGLKSRLGAVIGWFRALPGRFVGWIGDLGGLLKSAGSALIQGLYDGILDKWHDVQNLVGGMAGWIKDHKGPISEDRVLLKPAGEAIMDGLIDAIQSRKGKLRQVLESVKVTVSQAFSETMADQLAQARDSIASLRQRRAELAASPIDYGAFKGFRGNLFGADISGGEGGPTGLAALLDFAKAQRAQAEGLASDVTTLVGKGLSQDLIDQLKSQGASGIAQIHALASASAEQIAQINADMAAAEAGNIAAGVVAGEQERADRAAELAVIDRQLAVASAGVTELARKVAELVESPTVIEVHIHQTGRTIVKEIKAEERATNKQYLVSA